MVKFITCPNCGKVFKSPRADLKFTGLGFTFPGLGVIKCPSCGERKRRKVFNEAQETDLKNENSFTEGTKAPAPKEEDALEDSKFEDE